LLVGHRPIAQWRVSAEPSGQPSKDRDENLMREGVAADKIERVGTIIIDLLRMMGIAVRRGMLLPPVRS
jgi:hypothetical protein